mgnify:CR=1 FL=1|jgi:hypothetical protein
MTVKQRIFAEAYIGEARCNASEAARIAGYKCPGQLGHVLLKNVEIRQYIDERIDQIAATGEEVLRTLADHMRGCVFLRVTENGDAVLDMRALKQAKKLHLVKSIKHTRYGPTVEMYDSQSAAIHLGKYHRLWGDRLDDVSKLSDDELRAEAARLLGGTGSPGTEGSVGATGGDSGGRGGEG